MLNIQTRLSQKTQKQGGWKSEEEDKRKEDNGRNEKEDRRMEEEGRRREKG